jgi:hypothetical protein
LVDAVMRSAIPCKILRKTKTSDLYAIQIFNNHLFNSLCPLYAAQSRVSFRRVQS